MKNALNINKISKQFGKRKAVDNLFLEIGEGQIFSLLGTNGAGKTTTIKMLCGLLRPDSGTANIMGKDIVKDIREIRKIIGVSPQETAIAAHLNTMENLVLMAGVNGLSGSVAKTRAKELMLLMDLENRKDQARKLSGGMQRRLSIAMALMNDPQVLFLDEPTLGLDPHARKSVWNYIEKLKGQKTIFLTTHYLEEADALADQIAIMKDGIIVDSGTSNELKQKHAGEKTIKITVKSYTDTFFNDLDAQNISYSRNHEEITLKNNKLNIYDTLEIFRNHNIEILGIDMNVTTLDDVFIKLTKKEDNL